MTQLSIPEAAKFILDSHTEEYRRTCIEFWRGLYGDKYADSVAALVKQK